MEIKNLRIGVSDFIYLENDGIIIIALNENDTLNTWGSKIINTLSQKIDVK